MAPLPFDKMKLSASDRALYEKMAASRAAKGAPFDGPYAALANHTELCARIEALGHFLKFDGVLPRNAYQFIVLCVAKQTGAAFEWIDHVEHAREAGVPEETLEALRHGGLTDARIGPPYDLLARTLQHTLAWQDVPQSLQDACIAQFGVKGFIEIVVVSGFYQMFSAINQGFAVPLPKGAQNPFAAQ